MQLFQIMFELYLNWNVSCYKESFVCKTVEVVCCCDSAKRVSTTLCLRVLKKVYMAFKRL